MVDDEIRIAVHKGLPASEIMETARKKGTLTLLESGLKRVEEGITSLEEVLSVAAV